MLCVEIKINQSTISTAYARNISELADVSDYHVRGFSEASSLTNCPKQQHQFNIEGHKRNQSAWALVAKMATEMAERENRSIAALSNRKNI